MLHSLLSIVIASIMSSMSGISIVTLLSTILSNIKTLTNLGIHKFQKYKRICLNYEYRRGSKRNGRRRRRSWKAGNLKLLGLSGLLCHNLVIPVGWKARKLNDNKGKDWEQYLGKNGNGKCQLDMNLRFQLGGRSDWSEGRKKRNNMIRSVNGNIGNSINVMQWNAGARGWERKRDNLEHLTEDESPDFLFITEANRPAGLPEHTSQINGYQTVFPKSMETKGFSRIVLLIKEGVIFEVDRKLMEDDDIASIWIKVRGKGRKNMVIGGVYREHTLLDQPGISAEPANQKRRWKNFVRQWRRAIQQYDSCWVVGDLNLDMQRWNNPRAEHAEMIELVKNDIETNNFVQLIDEPTRFWQDQPQSILDHVWTNSAERAISVKNKIRAISDHNVTGVKIRIKGQNNQSIETLSRDWSKLDVDSFIRSVAELDWSYLLECTDVTLAYNDLEEEIVKLLDEKAPMRKKQVRSKPPKWISEAAKEMIKERDKAREMASTSSLLEDWQRY